MDISDKLANMRLADFFANKKQSNSKKQGMQKKANAGYFRSVHDQEDIDKHAAMISELLSLPKYEAIKKRLSSSKGVVNFVTRGSYAPLYELLIRSAIPPSQNDIYHMGNLETTPEDYFVDTQALFGGVQGDPSARENSREQMTNMLFGKVKKHDKQWLMKNGILNEGQVDQDGLKMLAARFYPAVQPEPQGESQFGSSGTPMQAGEPLARQGGESESDRVQRIGSALAQQYVNLIQQYSNEKEMLKNSSLAEHIRKMAQTLRKDSESRLLNKSLPSDKQDMARSTLSDEHRQELLDKLRDMRNQYYMAEQAVENREEYNSLQNYDISFSGTPEREGGFVNWDPVEQISNIYSRIRPQKSGEKKVTASEFNNLVDSLYDTLASYQTTDKRLVKLKRELMNFFGTGDKATKVQSNIRYVSQKLDAFIEAAEEHGRVMIMTNFDKCPLTQYDQLESDCELNDGGLLGNFAEAGAANRTKSRQSKPWSPTGGNKLLILVSDVPINNLPNATVINMETSPVDDKEAEIIVRHLMTPITKRAFESLKSRYLVELEQKFRKGEIDQQEFKKQNMEKAKELLTMKGDIGQLDEQTQSYVEDLITGLTQGEAINTAENALSYSVVQERTDDGDLIGLEVDEEALMDRLSTEINEKASEGARGLEVRRSHTSFEHYIYDDTTDFGAVVNLFHGASDDIMMYTQNIETKKQELRDIDQELMSGNISNERTKELTELKQQAKDTISSWLAQRHNALKSLPHFVVLYGPPGSGKSVFADALADLMGFMVYNVDVDSLRNKWVGSTGQNVDRLINTIFGGSRRAVFLFDEIDRVMESGGDESGSGGGSQTHETTKSMVTKFLNAFADRREDLVDKDVFCIMTTNNQQQMASALKSRADGGVLEVRQSSDPEDYKKFIQYFLEEEKSRTPNNPFVKVSDDPEEGWKKTQEIINSIDVDAVAKAYCDKRLSFRSMATAIRNALYFDDRYKKDVEAFKRGDLDNIRGMPYTTENMVLAAEYAYDPQGSSDQNPGRSGIESAVSLLNKEANKKLREVIDNLEYHDATDPVTGRKITARDVPQDIIDMFHNGQSLDNTADDIYEQFDIEEEEVETEEGKIKQKKLRPVQPQQPESEGFEEQPLVDEETGEDTGEETDESNEDENEDENEINASSSSEYLLKFLQRQGVISQDGKKVVDRNNLKVQSQTNSQSQKDDLGPFQQWVDYRPLAKEYGMYFYHEGQFALANVQAGSEKEKL